MLATIIFICQWAGAATGLLGAYALQRIEPYMLFYAFLSFTVSNVFLIVLFILTAQWPLLVMQVVFLFLSVSGLCKLIRRAS